MMVLNLAFTCFKFRFSSMRMRSSLSCTIGLVLIAHAVFMEIFLKCGTSELSFSSGGGRCRGAILTPTKSATTFALSQISSTLKVEILPTFKF